MMGGINFTVAIIAFGFMLWVTKDKWRGKIGL